MMDGKLVFYINIARNINRPRVFEINHKGLLNFNGKEHCVIKLGRDCKVEYLLVDTNHYKGNFPESCEVHYSDAKNEDEIKEWKVLLERVKLSAHCITEFKNLCENKGVTFVKLTMIPDGGISRFRVFGSY
jgi:allantoicase